MSDSFMEMINQHWDFQTLQVPRLPADTPAFYRNLEERMDKKRSYQGLNSLRLPRPNCVDFSSNDFLNLGSSGLVREKFFDELARHEGFALGSTSSRLMDGNHSYAEDLEQELADFHGEESGLIFGSGFEANGAIFSTIPSKGDVIVYDELVHASIHHGMKNSKADAKIMFKHNDVADLRKVLLDVRENHPLIRDGQRTVLISIESVYSMDGDVAPATEFIQVAKEIFTQGQAQFVIDEAHSTGCIGPQGKGLVAELALEGEFAIRLATFGKSLACTGAVVMCKKTIRNILINYAKGFIYTTGPSFTTYAAMKGALRLMQEGYLEARQVKLQNNVRHFMDTITQHPQFNGAISRGIFSIPVLHQQGTSYKDRTLLTHVVPICTRDKEAILLTIQLQQNDFVAWPVDYPVVPKGEGRVRLVFHSDNTTAEVEQLSELVMEFAIEMMRVDDENAADAAEEAEQAIVDSAAAVNPQSAALKEEESDVSDSASSSGDESPAMSSRASTTGTDEVPTPGRDQTSDTVKSMIESVKKLDLFATQENALPQKSIAEVVITSQEFDTVNY